MISQGEIQRHMTRENNDAPRHLDPGVGQAPTHLHGCWSYCALWGPTDAVVFDAAEQGFPADKILENYERDTREL